MFNLEMT